MESDEEGVVGGGLEDVLLGLHPVDVLVVRHQLLLDHLHRVDPLVLLQLHHQHLSEMRTINSRGGSTPSKIFEPNLG